MHVKHWTFLHIVKFLVYFVFNFTLVYFCAALHIQYLQISGQLLFNRTINQSHNNEVLYFSSGLSRPTVHFHSSMVMKLLRKSGKCIPGEKTVGWVAVELPYSSKPMIVKTRCLRTLEPRGWPLHALYTLGGCFHVVYHRWITPVLSTANPMAVTKTYLCRSMSQSVLSWTVFLLILDTGK